MKSRVRHKTRRKQPQLKPRANPPETPADSAALLPLLGYLPWLALLGFLLSVTWFLCDDAYIGFRYVRNLVEGHGLVFNRGEYVEGYTNFLWLLKLAALWSLFGIPPEQAAPYLSVACTLGTLAAMLWWVYRMPSLPHRRLVGWMALGLVCSSATFAVWTSAGGLETRAFTLFITVAVVTLSVHGNRPRGLLLASLSLGAAELTRPEGLLLGVCFLGGFAVARMAGRRRLRPHWRELALMAGPFILVVASHYLWRYYYYGEYLPNTYYAKYVSPWYASGIPYLLQAAIDTGLYLLLPLASAAAVLRWRRCGDATYAVILPVLAVHMLYLARIGGDHFEYRPMDYYWPLLAVAASEMLVLPGALVAARMRKSPQPGAVRIWALALFAPVLLYAGAIQGALLYEGSNMVIRNAGVYTTLDEDNAGRWLVLPGMPQLVAVSNTLRRESARRYAPSPWAEHRSFGWYRLRQWKPYERMARGTLPDDAVGQTGSTGIMSYYLPDLEIIDLHGLTDATVARNRQTLTGNRRIAHERQPPPGYLERRKVNFYVRPAARSAAEALSHAGHALQIESDLWMPFDADPRWVAEAFGGHKVVSKQQAGG